MFSVLGDKFHYRTNKTSPRTFCGVLEGIKEGANKQVISSQADSLIKISRIWADFFPANTSNQPIWGQFGDRKFLYVKRII
ncbi:hypothetical protein DNU08_27655 [Escherichia coli]|nr:hypothetical protein [Escherichia coli]EFO3733887.1 hypothetical protein [Escherichia coli]EGD4671362.1 hypothetical protein [Escherichia coli]OJS01999.1 hypothetical protein BK394_23350 [Escherichia coli]